MLKVFKNAILTSSLASLFVLMAACGGPKETIFIISTNDMHGAIENFPSLATVVKEYRGQDSAAVLLVDAGDRWTGNPYVDMAPTAGYPIIELMNGLEYDVATFGNHEFDRGLAHLDSLTRMADFPVILANMDTGSSPLAQPAPYEIVEAGDHKVAFVGLVTNFINGHPDGKDEIFTGTHFPSPYDTAERYRGLRDSADVLVALTHIGDDADSVLAARVPVFDLIIGGHTHVVMDPARVYAKTTVTQAGKNLRYAGITEVTLRRGRVKSINNHLIRLDTVAADPEYAARLLKYYDNAELNKTIGSLSEKMTKAGAANLFTDVARRTMKTDFAFYHIGGVRVDGFEPGDVRKVDIYHVEPFESRMYRVDMTLGQIKEMIMNKFNDTANSKESHREDIFPSGMSYTIVTDERGEAVDVIFDYKLPGPKGFREASHKYSVALSDYMYGQYKFEKPSVKATSPLVTDMLFDEFARHSPLKPDNKMRIVIRRR